MTTDQRDPVGTTQGAEAARSGAPQAADWFGQCFAALRTNIASAIHGKDEQIELSLICLLAGGHLLLEDVPGVGKTSLAKAVARSVGGEFGRVQFTPDLLPTDVVGTSIWNQAAATFEFRRGPIFANIVLADEINRASPRTQSALLEAMAEQQVTTEGRSLGLPTPFMVIATQNPIEHMGTYELPESQMDRFLMKLSLGYPQRSDESALLRADGSHGALEHMSPAISLDHLHAMIAHCESVHLSDSLTGYLLDILTASRSHPAVELGASPRAGLGLQRAARVLAAIQGRDFVTADDIKLLAPRVLSHRIVLHRQARMEGDTAQSVLQRILEEIAIPASAE